MQDNICIVHIFRSRQYMSYRDGSKLYGFSSDRLRELINEAEQLPRYRNEWVTINRDGVTLFNSLVFEDFLHCRSTLKQGLGKHLPPYSAAKVREQRGEVTISATG